MFSALAQLSNELMEQMLWLLPAKQVVIFAYSRCISHGYDGVRMAKLLDRVYRTYVSICSPERLTMISSLGIMTLFTQPSKQVKLTLPRTFENPIGYWRLMQMKNDCQELRKTWSKRPDGSEHSSNPTKFQAFYEYFPWRQGLDILNRT